MKNRANRGLPAQGGAGLLPTAQQLLVPMMEGIVHTRRELFAWIQRVGIDALQELFELDVVEMAGAKGKHCLERSHYRWGAAPIVLPFGGQRITVPCPRVRAVQGGEAQLKNARHFRAVDPVTARVLNQILLGVSTRGYRTSLEPVPAGISARGASKSAASRHLIAHARPAARTAQPPTRSTWSPGVDGGRDRDRSSYRGSSAGNSGRWAQSDAGPVAGLD
jgi:hypothetical protein